MISLLFAYFVMKLFNQYRVYPPKNKFPLMHMSDDIP